jgi:hypothetical protein
VEEATSLSKSVRTKSSSQSSQSKSKSKSIHSNLEAVEYDEPISLSPFQDMGITLGVMAMCNKLDLTNAKIIKYARYVLYIYIYMYTYLILRLDLRESIL